ncbi:uncharacterized protein EI97DRAFT_28062 [Westerdykella ornata]|uniref:Uncharacterized protein n=1 Tax=Westerdykella ornata TaxID=318751 RepID=A0A6A6JXQ3_WESOR|nr:uncharacterized protein EI97DRAFT_28062 [Westerdykella ornata]KAF2281400.1 hypothetical protein EI97DRAFT_28062 [Westerdykella ornata]
MCRDSSPRLILGFSAPTTSTARSPPPSRLGVYLGLSSLCCSIQAMGTMNGKAILGSSRIVVAITPLFGISNHLIGVITSASLSLKDSERHLGVCG